MAESISPVLLAANQRLLQRRAAVQGEKGGLSGRTGQGLSDTLTGDTGATATASLGALPNHLGWGSPAETAVLHRRMTQAQRTAGDESEPALALATAETWDREQPNSPKTRSNRCVVLPNSPAASLEQAPQAGGWVKLYPGIGLGMLRQGRAASGRLWLMLRYLDMSGSGFLRIDITKQQLTKKSKTPYLCGKRQLRNLLRDGEGVYWTRDKQYLWLRSAAKVAHALGVERLTGRPVALPLAALLDGIGTFRAHLYAAFHSGRTKKAVRDAKAMPIARDTIADLSGVGPSSQRAYEVRVGIKVQPNFAVGDLATKENQEKQAWKRGQALFELKDYRGQQGKKGETYLAWQLPNTYIGQHQHRPKGRQRRINRELKDLVMKGMPGNVGGTSEAQRLEKRYYPDGKLAAEACGRNGARELYWRRQRAENGRFDLWQWL